MPRMVDQLEIGPNTLKLLKERHELDGTGSFEGYIHHLVKTRIAPIVQKIWMEAKVQGKGTPYLQKLYLDVLLTFLEEERARAELVVAIGLASKREDDKRTREEIREAQKSINANMRDIRKMQDDT